jgi:2-amino-4-hydroxy-6-hydroxymethyldihydropteridine diphosphokinase
MASPVRAYIGLGANLGDARATLDRAVSAMGGGRGCAECRASTRPCRSGLADYLNAVSLTSPRTGPGDRRDNAPGRSRI